MPKPYRNRALAAFLAATTLFVAGCWDQKELPGIRDQLCKSIDNWHDRAIRTCNNISDKELRDHCLLDVARKNDELSSKKQEAINAYINCKKEAFKDALDAIKDLLKSVVKVAANFDSPLGPDGEVAFAGKAKLTREVLLDARFRLPGKRNTTAADGMIYTYALTSGGTIDITAWDLPTQHSDLTGSISLSLAAVNGGYVGAVQGLNLNFKLDGESAKLTLDPDGLPSQVEIAPDGTGVLRFHGSLAWSNFDAAVNWYELPVKMAGINTLLLDTGVIPGDTLFPPYDTAPHVEHRSTEAGTPAARIAGDTNADQTVDVHDIANILAAYGRQTSAYDLTGDGKVDRVDLQQALTALRAR